MIADCVATLAISTAVHLEVGNVDNTATLNATQSIHCVPRTCEVNSSVLVDCIMKIDTQEYQATLCHQTLHHTQQKCNRNV
jgi:hypothetical protein